MSNGLQCSDCGRFFSGAKKHAWKMVYGGAPIATPDREIYRCEKCLDKYGEFTPQHGIRPEYSCGLTTPTPSTGSVENKGEK